MSNRALVVDDHPIVSETMVSSLISLGVFDEVVTASSLKQTTAILSQDHDFKLLMLDLHLSDTDGIEGMTFLRETYPDIPIIIFSGESSIETISKAFEYGVRGFIPKSSAVALIVNAIKVVLSGSSYIPPEAIKLLGIEPTTGPAMENLMQREQVNFSPKQMAVFLELLDGSPNKIIAARLDIAEGTVKTHLHTIYQVLKVRNRAQAILKARELGII